MGDPFFLGNPRSPNVPGVGGKPVLMGPDSILGFHEVPELVEVIILKEGWKLVPRIIP